MPNAQTVVVALAVLTAGCTTLVGDTEPTQVNAASFHERLIWSHPYPNLEVTVHYVEDLDQRNLAPTRFALNTLEQTLQNVTAKESVTVREPEPISVEDGSPSKEWTRVHPFAILERVAGDNEVSGTEETGTVHLKILYVNGHLSQDRPPLGMAAGPFILLFPDEFDYPAPSVGSFKLPAIPTQIVERSVLVHEAGHSLGLVGRDTLMQTDRQAADRCNCHSTNEDSVMYKHAQTNGALWEYIDKNGEHVPYEFDQYDLADLRAVREAEPPP